jgi:hypothetical protein
MVSGDSAEVTFHAQLRGIGIDARNRSSVWRLRNDVLELVAQAGMHPPGVEGDLTFREFGAPLINGEGQIAFRASLNDARGIHMGQSAIWAEDAARHLRLLVREGDFIDVDPGPAADMRHIFEAFVLGSDASEVFDSFHGEGQQPFAFNDRGQLAFIVTFTDSTRAVVVSNKLIPEPHAESVALTGIIAMVLIARRSRTDPIPG